MTPPADARGVAQIGRADSRDAHVRRDFDALVFGYYDGDRLIYVARTRNGFTPTYRERLLAVMKTLEIPNCPFANLPEATG